MQFRNCVAKFSAPWERALEAGEEKATKYILVILVIAVGVAVVFELVRVLRIYLKFRGKRMVSCPETHQPAGVRVDARKVAVNAVLGLPNPRLSECSRWPEKEGCGQECLSQIKEAPHACLVSTIVNQWYAGRSCAFATSPSVKSIGMTILPLWPTSSARLCSGMKYRWKIYRK